MSKEPIQIRVSDSLKVVQAEDWDRMVGEGSPFLEYTWLRGLEETGCLEPDEGWMPQILTAWQGERLVGGVPLYLKGNSYGEFVYDWSWANLASQLGVPYYPKLIAAVPFTPVTGQRVLVDPTLEKDEQGRVLEALVEGSKAWARQSGVLGLHFLFVPQWQAEFLAERGLMIRLAHQYHWRNPGYSSFDDFLARFNSRRRNKLKRERKELAKAGMSLEFLAGDQITTDHMAHVLRFYKDTCRKFGPWTSQYLKDDFFELLHQKFTDRLQLVLAHDSDGEVIAGTFSLHKGKRLYGRYWGCFRDVPFLHFNACYYAPIERAIELGVDVYEPGQGGHHKYKRGFEPTLMYSAHWLADERFRGLIEHFLERERAAVKEEVGHMLEQSPLKPWPLT